MSSVSPSTRVQGALFAIAAYVAWGLLPIYLKWLDQVTAWEILAQRVLWSVVLLLGLLAATRQLHVLKLPRRHWPWIVLSAGLLTVNWGAYIYAVIIDNIVEASLGYFINPLVTVLLGMVFLGERLNRWQSIAILIASAGIVFQLISYGSVPWIALALAFSFGLYGLVRKRMNVHAIGGLCLETLVLLPPALACLGILWQQNELRFLHTTITIDLLLIAAGLVTSFPLLCFNAAVTKISLISMGMFQYLAPTMTLVIAVLIYNEPFGIDRWITFACIWAAILIFTIDAIAGVRRPT
ncbi:MAG: EamA family transporter RarD [Pseudomonadota bacterium]